MDFLGDVVDDLCTVKREPEEEEEDEEEEAYRHLLLASIQQNGQHAEEQTPIQLGQSFRSFTEVFRAVQEYEMIHQIRLTQKYFRRIAAKPKPTNKEDYMLTEEERKRFVYRWVDFCCTYFDDLQTFPQDGSIQSPAFGFTVKECPMRIRFQMRFQERDLVVSIFTEGHDHETPPDPPAEEAPTMERSMTMEETGNEFLIGKRSKKVTPACDNRVNIKRSTRPLPSLKLLSSNSPKTSSNTFLQAAKLGTSKNVTIEAPTLRFLPKPPPLSKASSTVTVPEGSRVAGVSSKSDQVEEPMIAAESIIVNIYNALRQMHSHGSNEIAFTTPRPNFVNLTANLAGVDEKIVQQMINKGKITKTLTVPKATSQAQRNRSLPNSIHLNTLPGTGSSSGNNSWRITDRPAGSTQSRLFQRRRSSNAAIKRSLHNLEQLNREINTAQLQLGNLPVDVDILIKSEPSDY